MCLCIQRALHFNQSLFTPSHSSSYLPPQHPFLSLSLLFFCIPPWLSFVRSQPCQKYVRDTHRRPQRRLCCENGCHGNAALVEWGKLLFLYIFIFFFLSSSPLHSHLSMRNCLLGESKDVSDKDAWVPCLSFSFANKRCAAWPKIDIMVFFLSLSFFLFSPFFCSGDISQFYRHLRNPPLKTWISFHSPGNVVERIERKKNDGGKKICLLAQNRHEELGIATCILGGGVCPIM